MEAYGGHVLKHKKKRTETILHNVRVVGVNLSQNGDFNTVVLAKIFTVAPWTEQHSS